MQADKPRTQGARIASRFAPDLDVEGKVPHPVQGDFGDFGDFGSVLVLCEKTGSGLVSSFGTILGCEKRTDGPSSRLEAPHTLEGARARK